MAGPAGFALLHLLHADSLIFDLCDIKAVVAIGALETGIHGMGIMAEYGVTCHTSLEWYVATTDPCCAN